MESLICTFCTYLDFFLVCKLFKFGLQIMPFISDHLRFTVLLLAVFNCDILKKGSVLIFRYFFSCFFSGL